MLSANEPIQFSDQGWTILAILTQEQFSTFLSNILLTGENLKYGCILLVESLSHLSRVVCENSVLPDN